MGAQAGPVRAFGEVVTAAKTAAGIASRASAEQYGHYFEPTVYNFGMTCKRLDDGATLRTVGSAAHVLQLVRFQFPAQRAAVVQLGFHGLSPCRGGLDQWAAPLIEKPKCGSLRRLL
jgi:hypothetical protein